MKKLLSLTLLLTTLTTYANDSTYHPQGTWWINGGVGAGWLVSHVESDEFANNDGADILGAVSFNYALFDTQFIELRAMGTGNMADVVNNIFCVSCGPYVNSVSDIGLMYGLMKKEKTYMVGGSIGLAYTDIEYKEINKHYNSEGNYFFNETEKTNHAVLGFPFEAQLFYTPFEYVGLGVIGMGNLNSEGSVMGVLLALQVGKLRS